jgi:hypothetical protein
MWRDKAATWALREPLGGDPLVELETWISPNGI